MDKDTKRTFIQFIARRNQSDPTGSLILWSRHATAELVNEGWLRRTVEDALTNCAIIEDYPHLHRPLPDCLVLGWLSNQQPVHAVIAIDEARGRLFVVTVYKPSAEEWENDWQTRK